MLEYHNCHKAGESPGLSPIKFLQARIHDSQQMLVEQVCSELMDFINPYVRFAEDHRLKNLSLSDGFAGIKIELSSDPGAWWNVSINAEGSTARLTILADGAAHLEWSAHAVRLLESLHEKAAAVRAQQAGEAVS